MAGRKHRVVIAVEGKQIDGWLTYELESNMIEPADAWSMTRPWNAQAWNLLERDVEISVVIDGVTVLVGYVDDKRKSTKAGTFTIGGRDKAGRLTQESAPAASYGGVSLLEAVKKLASPWFENVSLSDARNRALRRGKGRRVPAGNEPLIQTVKTPARGKVTPGTMRWAAIEELVSQAGYACWSSADGRELVIGRPNYSQAPQYLLYHALPGGTNRSTVIDLDFCESNGDRYSMIACVGSGGGTAVDYGEAVSSRAGVVFDNDDIDGTGRDFKRPKRLLLPERNLDANNDARRVAEREAARRNFRRTILTAEMDQHGQWLGSVPTIFAPNTIARVVDEDFDPPMDERFLIYSCKYRCSRDEGQTTVLELVPDETEIVL